MKSRNSLLSKVVLGSLFVSVGCSSNEPTKSQASGFYLSSAKWQSPDVTVCWENGTGSDVTQRRWVEQAVKREYNGPTPLHFIGWRDCPAQPQANIRIRIADVGPHTVGLGRRIDGRPGGMSLNFTFQNWSQSCRSHSQSCIESIAVHEFGHAAGLAHEHNRDDRPANCQSESQGTDGDVSIGAFDSRSVMNYCNSVYKNNGRLSAGDLQTLRDAYASF